VTILPPLSRKVPYARAQEEVLKTSPENHHIVTPTGARRMDEAKHDGLNPRRWQPRPALRDDLPLSPSLFDRPPATDTEGGL
jgi:hypothetical protein